MSESWLAEMRRYLAFGAEDEAALRALAPRVAPHHAAIAAAFYARATEHEDARRVFVDLTQVQRLQGTLQVWLRELLEGPWDDAYHERRMRIGRTHVAIRLPQRYMFAGMSLIRAALHRLASDDLAASIALDKVLDLELAIMLESYADTVVRRVEARYEEIVERGEALMVTWEPGRPIVVFNRRCEELTGIDRDAARRTTWFELFGSGRDDPMHARERELLDGKRLAPIERALQDPQGREHRIRWQLTTLVEPDRTFVCAVGLDFTEEHELGVRTRRAERLASLGTMAAGLAHEIRNPLNSAQLQLALVDRRLQRAPAEVDGAREAATLATGEIKRLAGLVGEFLDFARPQQLRRFRGDLRKTAEAIVALVRPEAAAAGVTLVLAPGSAVCATYDDEKIKQVLHNLVRNGIEASGAGGTVRIVVTARPEVAVIDVEDDGPGIPRDAPVFEPFFTTKEAGTGLGLAIVHRICADHGGRVDIQSRPGRTVVSVSLPLAQGLRDTPFQ